MAISEIEPLTGTGLSVCMFGGASAGGLPDYAREARVLGSLLAAAGHRLVYGAGGNGLMGAVAAGMAEGGGEIVGVIPRFLRQREMGDGLPAQEVVLTENLLERKQVMIERADAFIALPGGYGTLDEVLEVVSMAALGLAVGPIVLVDVAGDWQPLVGMVGGLFDRGFLRRTDMFEVVPDAAAAVALIGAAVGEGGLPRVNAASW